MKKYLITTFLSVIVLICCSQINGQTIDPKKNDTAYFKITLVQPEVEMPTGTVVVREKSPLDFYVFVNTDSISIKFNNKSLENISLQELDAFIKKNNIAEVSPRKAICSNSTASMEKIKEVLDVFQRNSIDRFNLLTNPLVGDEGKKP